MPATVNERQARNGPITVLARQVRPLAEMAAKAGVKVAPILAGIGLPDDLFAADPDARVPLSAHFRLHHQMSFALEDETCQLAPRQHLPGTMDFVLSHLQGAETLHEAMRAVADYYNLLHGGEYNSVRRKGDLVSFMIDDRNFPFTLKDADYVRFSMECVQIFTHCMLATIAPKSALTGLRRVGVRRERREPETNHLSFWDVPIHYGDLVYAIDYSAEAAMQRLVLPPMEFLTRRRVYAQTVAMIEARGTQGPPPQNVADFVRDALRRGLIDQRRIAGLLDLSVATLRRRLAEEGSSFRALRKEALNETAQDLLRKRRPIADVAEELGFSEFRSFNRAFKDWNGVTPKAFMRGIEADAQRGP
jgi:AraC-like DNA-binding protein